MDVKKILLGGVLGGIAIFIVSFVFGYLVQLVLPYNMLELGGMRAVEDPLMLLFFVSPWVTSFAMAIVYSFVKSSFQGNKKCAGKKFGLLVWLVAGLPSAFIVYTSMTYPLGFTVDSVIGSLLYFMAAGIVIAKFS